jgi:hypothetical protein
MAGPSRERPSASCPITIEAHRTTLVFVNTRRPAERVPHHLCERWVVSRLTHLLANAAKQLELVMAVNFQLLFARNFPHEKSQAFSSSGTGFYGVRCQCYRNIACPSPRMGRK